MSRVCMCCGQAVERVPVRASVRVMYECHLFERLQVSSVEGVLGAWWAHLSEPHTAVGDDGKEYNLGKAMLCPVILLDAEGRDVRRVGRLLFPNSKTLEEDIAQYRALLHADPDVSRLLAGEVHE